MLKLTGQRFGRLVAIERRELNPQGKYYWLFKCDCGQEKLIIPYDVTSGKTQSCGCYHKERASEANMTHGQNRDNNDIYMIWVNMRDRCNRPTSTAYKYYGALGVTYSIEWNEFSTFERDMGPRPSLKHSLDRINPHGNYEVSNCRWATAIEQNQNTRKAFDRKQILNSL